MLENTLHPVRMADAVSVHFFPLSLLPSQFVHRQNRKTNIIKLQVARHTATHNTKKVRGTSQPICNFGLTVRACRAAHKKFYWFAMLVIKFAKRYIAIASSFAVHSGHGVLWRLRQRLLEHFHCACSLASSNVHPHTHARSQSMANHESDYGQLL